MPELPEVETIRRGLLPLVGSSVIQVYTIDSWLRFPLPPNLTILTGQTLTAIERRAKYLILIFSTDTLIVHLGMTGRFALRSKPTKHDKFSLTFSPQKTLYFNDSRRFGFARWQQDVNFSQLGPEPWDASCTPEYLHTRLNKLKSELKPTLLNQTLIVGLGNIYVCEALYHAQISPTRRCCDVTLKESEYLLSAIRHVLERAINLGGSSLKDYYGVEGGKGGFQTEFCVYGQAGRLLPEGSVVSFKQAGRTTFYCPGAQY
jgi:formamidopyrimidine-DNA glycosylase